MENLSEISFLGELSVAERDEILFTMPQETTTDNITSLDSKTYPQININRDIANESFMKAAVGDEKSVLISVNERLLKRVFRTFFEEGWKAALHQIGNPRNSPRPWISAIAGCVLKGQEFINSLDHMMRPNLVKQDIDCLPTFLETRDWTKSVIRYIAWHPNCNRIAVADFDDSIRVFFENTPNIPPLKSAEQKGITCMAWRSFSPTELAVGCETGLFVWTISSALTRPNSQLIHLKDENHVPVTSVVWSTDGRLLATASIQSSDITVWNVDDECSQRLKRVTYPCVSLKWSPDGSRLLATTVGNIFLVWQTENNWSAEPWTTGSGHIQSAVWSPCSKFLLFATSREPILYKLKFENKIFSVQVSEVAIPAVNLLKQTIDNCEVGGMPQSLAWDPSGNYLAISFKETASIAIYATRIRKGEINITPSNFVNGIGTEQPSVICFQSKHHLNSNTVLTIGWSSGRVQYFHIY